MFAQELRQPWCIAMLVAILLALGLLLHDRARTPLYQWPENPNGIPANEFQLFNKKREPTRHPFDPMMHAVGMCKGPQDSVKHDLPSAEISDRQDDYKSPLSIDEEGAKAIRAYCRYEREALREAHARGRDIRFDTPAPTGWLLVESRQNITHRKSRLHFALFQEMLLHTLDNDTKGALRSVETMYKLAQSSADYADAEGQHARIQLLQKTYDAVRVLINRVALQPEHWMRLTEMTTLATSGLNTNIGAAAEYEATVLLHHYGYPQLNPFRAEFADELYRDYGQAVPRTTREVIAQSLFALAGFEHSDKAHLVRLAQSIRQSFETAEGLEGYSVLDSLTGPATWELKNSFWSLHYTVPTCVAFPQLLRAAALVDGHRQLHGAFPESLEAVGADTIQDPFGTGALGYIATKEGVKIYTLGRDGLDNTDPNAESAPEDTHRSPDDHSLELRH